MHQSSLRVYDPGTEPSTEDIKAERYSVLVTRVIQASAEMIREAEDASAGLPDLPKSSQL